MRCRAPLALLTRQTVCVILVSRASRWTGLLSCFQQEPPACARLGAGESGGGDSRQGGGDAHQEEAGAGHQRAGGGSRRRQQGARRGGEEQQEDRRADPRSAAAGTSDGRAGTVRVTGWRRCDRAPRLVFEICVVARKVFQNWTTLQLVSNYTLV